MMKRLLLSACMAVSTVAMWAVSTSETVHIGDKDYELVKLEERCIGPGAVYTRYRMPLFPLNINLLKVDVTNEYNIIETSLPNDMSAGTELLVEAAKRYDAPRHRPMAAQNSNFWIVSTQPQWAAYGASTHNVNMRNGMLAIDSRSFPHWWWWDTTRSGIVAYGADKSLHIDVCATVMTFSSAKTGTREYHACNKGFKTGQTAIYTPCFGADRQFLPLKDDTPEQQQWNDIHYDVDEASECTEVLLTMADGESWAGGRDMRFTVAEVRRSNGRGTLGDFDLAIVSRDVELQALAPGDEVKLNYSWVFDPDGERVVPEVMQAVGGNMMVMRHGEVTEQNDWDSYNTMVYSRSAYGSSADGKTLFMVVIDKSIDQTYGQSNGCTTREMCELMRYLGCYNLINVDAGGSAELMIGDRIINRTTEGTPRAVGNGWMVFNTAPEDDDEVAALAFDDVALQAPVYGEYSPRVIAYNRYGSVIDYDYRDYTITADEAIGEGRGNVLQLAGTPGRGEVTVAVGEVKASKTIEITAATPAMVIDNIVIDEAHPYRIGVRLTSTDGVTCTCAPERIAWHVADETVARVEKGVLKTVANGTTQISGTLDGVELTATVMAQTPDSRSIVLSDDWSKWTVKGSTGLKNVTVGADGTVTYTYSSPRGQSYISASPAITLFGIPEKVVVEFENDIPTLSVDAELRAAGVRRGTVAVTPDEPYAAGTTHTVEFAVSMAGDPDDTATYPLSLGAIRFISTVSNNYKGDRTLRIKSVRAEYAEAGGVGSVAVDTSAAGPIEYYDLQGRRVASAAMTPGIYVRRQGSSSVKIVVR